MIKIATHKTFQYGKVSIGLQVPPVFISDNKIKLKDEVDIFRGEYEGKDVLIIIPKINGAIKKTKKKLKSE